MIKKYLLLKMEKYILPSGKVVRLHRIQALRDIPRHNVKKGDLGGLVANGFLLSHQHDCWIGGDAIVCGNNRSKSFIYTGFSLKPLIHENAYIGGSSVVNGAYIGGDTNIVGSASIFLGQINKQSFKLANSQSELTIKGDISLYSTNINAKGELSGNGSVHYSRMTGHVHLSTNQKLESIALLGRNTIDENATIGNYIELRGENFIHGNSHVPFNYKGTNISLQNEYVNQQGKYDSIQGSIPGAKLSAQKAVSASETISPNKQLNVTPVNIDHYVNILRHIEQEYESYTTDIVKLIKYPAMVDANVPEVRNFMVLLKAANRSVALSDVTLPIVIPQLEDAYCLAENVAQKIAATHLDEKQRSSLKTAKQLLKIACDDEANENEKKMSFKAGIKALDGIIIIPEKAMDNLKEKIGILELESY